MKIFFSAGAGLLLFISSLFSQGKVEGGLYAEHFQLGYKGQEQFGGILHYPVGGGKFTLNYQSGIGFQDGGGFYAHTSAGAIAGLWLMYHSLGVQYVNYLGFILVLVPNGAGMYFGHGKIVQHISIDPLDVDYWHHYFPYEDRARMSGSIVYRVKLLPDLKWPIYIAPQVSLTMIYLTNNKVQQYGFRAGVCIGYQSNKDSLPIINQ
ncbi:MAG: hypothetical protein HY064_01880 [Bacteroidetes bacterium]|nr:hypothetical protein [Bacteroidota bacterium]